MSAASLLLQRAAEALQRKDGSMLLGYDSEFPSTVREAAYMMGLTVSVFDGMVLATLRVPRKARTARGDDVAIVTWHDGWYYDREGRAFRDKDLEWEQQP